MAVSPEEEWDYWDKKATELTRGQLQGVNAAAGKWSTLLGALLGIFGAVAFAGGLTTLDKLTEPWGTVARLVTTAAVGTAVVGTVLLGLASGGLTTSSINGPLDGMELRKRSEDQVPNAFRYLKAGRWFAAATASLVVLGSLLILWVGQLGDQDEAAPSYIGIFGDGATCGTLSVRADGTIQIGDRTAAGPLTDLVPVEDCPKGN